VKDILFIVVRFLAKKDSVFVALSLFWICKPEVLSFGFVKRLFEEKAYRFIVDFTAWRITNPKSRPF
jgi:hypothetical protein